MTARSLPLLFALALLGPVAPALAQKPAAPAAAAKDLGWPRTINRDGLKLVYFQPQVDDWKDRRVLNARLAIVVTPKGGRETPGIATLSGNTKVDLEGRTVFIDKLQIGTLKFPDLDAAASAPLEQLIRTIFPGKAMTISLDRLMALMEKSDKVEKGVAVKSDVPTILASPTPAILLMVPGQPVLGAVEGSNLQFVVNANWDTILDPATSRYFLLTDKVWVTSEKLEGPWTRAATLPAALKKLPAGGMWNNVRNAALNWTVSASVAVPRVFFSSVPAELMVFNGEPAYKPIPGTNLRWATNTSSHVFWDSANSKFYFLVTGRWFSAANLQGPWASAGKDLPADFKKIPPTDPSASALAAVPGTPDADDAVLLAQIPTTAIVNRAGAEAKVKVEYFGEPIFKPVDGTSLEYAVNTNSDVIRDGSKFYLCADAVWFVADSPKGAWKITSTVPAAIYTIPPNSPLFRLTYVQTQDTADPATVECSYTAGYNGSYVSDDGTLVWGTGYYYPPYTGIYGGYPVYRPYWATYGLAAAYNWGVGSYAVGGYAYGPYGTAGRAAYYNSATGAYGRAATAQGPYGGRTIAGGYNPSTGNAFSTKQAHGPYAQWGTTAATNGNQWVQAGHVTTANGTTAAVRTSQGAAVVHNGNVYAASDGNVYKADANGKWSKYGTGTTPQSTNKAAAQPAAAAARPSAETERALNKDYTARNQAELSAQAASRNNAAWTDRTAGFTDSSAKFNTGKPTAATAANRYGGDNFGGGSFNGARSGGGAAAANRAGGGGARAGGGGRR